MRPTPILMYHWFRPDGSASNSRSPQLEMTPSRFAEQMRYLKQRGYRTISLDEAVSATAPSHPTRTVVLTFDDGTLDFWRHALPVLDEHGFTASLFVVSGYVGSESSWDKRLGEPPRPLMDWEQIGTLHERGFEIGSHTHSHRVLTELSEDQVRSELSESRQEFERRLGFTPSWMAYPRGFYNASHKELVRQAGFTGACAVILGWGDLVRSGRFELMRMTIKGTESLARFRLRLGLAARVPRRDQ